MNNYGLDLSTATPQQVFDHVVGHLRQQGVKCETLTLVGKTGCSYRNTQGLACAAGSLIFDDDYVAAMEGTGWEDATSYLPSAYCHHVELVEALQDAHDLFALGDWEDKFRLIAISHSILYTEQVPQ